MKTTRRLRGILLAACMLLAVLLTGCSLDRGTQSSASGEVPKEMPTFSLQDMQGNTVTNAVFSKNALTLVNVWATTCSPCMDEMPELQSLSQTYGAKGVGFIGIVADGKDAAPQAKQLLQELGVTYTNLLPNDDFISRFISKQDAVPYTLLVDRTGKVVAFQMGSQSKAGFQSMIDQHLSK